LTMENRLSIRRYPAYKDRTIAAFMAKYITKPFEYLENVVGVELNFNKVFYQPEKLRDVGDILKEIQSLDEELKMLEEELAL
jgi:type I restriction enzyme M protein